MTKKIEATDAVLETINDLYEIGLVDKENLREFRLHSQLKTVPKYDAEMIRALRSRLNISQSVFAALLNATVSTVQKWEQGGKKTNGLAQKLLNVLDKHGIKVLL